MGGGGGAVLQRGPPPAGEAGSRVAHGATESKGESTACPKVGGVVSKPLTLFKAKFPRSRPGDEESCERVY